MAKGVSIDLIVDPKKAIAGIGQVESRASGASATLGKLGKVAGGAILGLAAAGAAGAVALGGAVVHAFSDYEQLAGGVTKLFGDADQQVTKFAQNAATTAGLSTNAYLDTVTSFSASLISGLHGDQKAAASAADRAVTDMADNANTFGTSVDSLQLAYQGFAKGNFTLLDNLKLGFGGSQQGMADLINSSGVLGGKMKVTAQNVKDVPFDKMIEAIHKVQVNMNIAGTTAKEASSTIGGSFNATKASLQNLVTGLGAADSDFGTLVGNVAKNAQNLVNNVAPVIGRLADALPQVVPVLISAVQKAIPAILPLAANLITSLVVGIAQAAPDLVTAAVPIVLNFVTGLVALLPTLVGVGVNVLFALITGITQSLPTLIPGVVTAIIGAITYLFDPQNLTALLDSGLQLVMALATGLIAAIPGLIAVLPAIILGIITFLVDSIPTLIDAGLTLFMALVGALPDIISGIVDAIPQIVTGLVVAVVSAYPKIIAAGVKLFIALIKNLPQIIVSIVKAIPDIIHGIVDAFGDPKVIAQLAQAGGDLIKGLWKGISDLGSWLWGKVSGFFGGFIDNVKGFFGIHSPSTVFAGFGDFMIQGLEKGLTGPNHLTGITQDLSRQVADGFDNSFALSAKATVGALEMAQGTGLRADGSADAPASSVRAAIVRPLDLSDSTIDKIGRTVSGYVRVQSRQGVQ